MEWKIEEEREVSALYFPFAFVVRKVITFIVLSFSLLFFFEGETEVRSIKRTDTMAHSGSLFALFRLESATIVIRSCYH
jgi:hypothetical protein